MTRKPMYKLMYNFYMTRKPMYMTCQAKKEARFKANRFTKMKISKLMDFAEVSSRNINTIPFSVATTPTRES